MIDLVEAQEEYVKTRLAIVKDSCTYETLVQADIDISLTKSSLELDCDNVRASIGINAVKAVTDGGKDWSEAKIERLWLDETKEIRHYLRIFTDLYSTIKGKQFRDNKV
jgi:hypothetical protein